MFTKLQILLLFFLLFLIAFMIIMGAFVLESIKNTLNEIKENIKK